MESFSERMGIAQKREFQINSMDPALTNRIWNASYQCLWERAYYERDPDDDIWKLGKYLWDGFFKWPVDEMYPRWYDNIDAIKGAFTKLPWNRVYEYIEFLLQYFPRCASQTKTYLIDFSDMCNKAMKEEMAGYRVVVGRVIRITNETEIQEVEKALSSGLDTVRTHISSAMAHLSNREKPDYRNSIKESISAVEAICAAIVKKKKLTLGVALETIKNDGKLLIDPALLEGYKKIYGWTSDKGGIRHAQKADDVSVTFDDAKYMLVSCSAFTNYLMMKAIEAGISLK